MSAFGTAEAVSETALRIRCPHDERYPSITLTTPGHPPREDHAKRWAQFGAMPMPKAVDCWTTLDAKTIEQAQPLLCCTPFRNPDSTGARSGWGMAPTPGNLPEARVATKLAPTIEPGISADRRFRTSPLDTGPRKARHRLWSYKEHVVHKSRP